MLLSVCMVSHVHKLAMPCSSLLDKKTTLRYALFAMHLHVVQKVLGKCLGLLQRY